MKNWTNRRIEGTPDLNGYSHANEICVCPELAFMNVPKGKLTKIGLEEGRGSNTWLAILYDRLLLIKHQLDSDEPKTFFGYLDMHSQEDITWL